MILKTSPKLRLSNDVWHNRRWEICQNELENFFYIPDNAKYLWVTVHDKPAKNRVAVEYGGLGQFVDWLYVDGERTPVSTYVYDIFKDIGRETAYVEIHYLEK